MSTYDDYCCSCSYLSEKPCDLYGNSWCGLRYIDRKATEEKCDRYTKAYGRSDSKKEKLYKNSKERQYIVTAILKKLFPGLQVPELEVSSVFRNNLEKDPNMTERLARYDVVGKRIAVMVQYDEELARNIYTNTVVPVMTLIFQGKDDEALAMYTKMVKDMLVKEPLQKSINTTTPYVVINHQIEPEMHDLKKEPVKILRKQR